MRDLVVEEVGSFGLWLTMDISVSSRQRYECEGRKYAER